MQTNCKTNTRALRIAMVEKGFNSIGILAETAKINRNTLGKVLSGKIQPTADIMTKLIVTLSIPADTAGNIFFERNLRNT